MSRGQFNTTLDEELIDKFREMAANVYGYKRGSLSEATTEALTNFIEKHRND